MYGLALDSLTDEIIDQERENAVRAIDDLRYGLVRKIQSSMGVPEVPWGDVECAYQKMRAFCVEIPDFSLRIDYVTHEDGWGQTRTAKISVDGVFAFYLFCKDRHVFTIGFSIGHGKKIFIGNAQAPKDTKGWGLQFLPRERLEYVIDLFKEHFERYEVYLVDGGDLIDRLIGDYHRELKQARFEFEQAESDEDRRVAQGWLDEFTRCIKHLQGDRARLEAAYKKTGRYRLAEMHHFNGLRYYRAEA